MMTGKQRVLEILELVQANGSDYASPSMTVDQALDSIEEVVLETIGNQIIYHMAHEEGVDPHYVSGYNDMVEATKLMREEQEGRWGAE